MMLLGWWPILYVHMGLDFFGDNSSNNTNYYYYYFLINTTFGITLQINLRVRFKEPYAGRCSYTYVRKKLLIKMRQNINLCSILWVP